MLPELPAELEGPLGVDLLLVASFEGVAGAGVVAGAAVVPAVVPENVGRSGRVFEPKFNVPVMTFTRPHTDTMIANATTPQIAKLFPCARFSSLAPPKIKYWNMPKINTMNAIAKTSGTIRFMMF
jgi:hypothetical protein